MNAGDPRSPDSRGNAKSEAVIQRSGYATHRGLGSIRSKEVGVIRCAKSRNQN